ncbi:3-ketosteroid-delta-1-dehydrogenase [Planctomycetes bacterium CA13]|uniref:3-ketosteroid-delta-1-dehydrogenase n=1 Tax=Novipirellula herctigrandis TaxID=2527986 RepID=A0A5C5ZAR1_9BACT|nr:3-ketosteroid-delta-1-dehydrogenase [Planctomycetes bacterium CA13]
MDRRDFAKQAMLFGVGAQVTFEDTKAQAQIPVDDTVYEEPPKKLPVRKVDVVIAGGGTAGVFAALAAARTGAKTMLIESKGYCGGVAVEGGTAIHSFYNLWKAFENCEKRQVVQGIPSEFMDRLTGMGGASGYPETETGFNYDSVCTNVDTEMYKLLAFTMLEEAGVFVAVNTLLSSAIVDNGRIKGVITESRSGREAVMAKSFIDCTGYGDLSARAGAPFSEPNDYASCNSFGMANADIGDYYRFLKSHGSAGQICRDTRTDEEDRFFRMGAEKLDIPGLTDEAKKIGMSMVTTTVHDNYLMYIKCNYKVPGSVLNRDDAAKAEIEIRKRMGKAVELYRKHVPGFENAFIARTSPSFCIRRGRCIECDYDISNEEIRDATHFDDDIYSYSFHDMGWGQHVKDGGSYGMPYRAICVTGIENLYAAGMLVTSDHKAHMSTRNTVSCMAMGQAAGTAAALCAKQNVGSRELSYVDLRLSLEKANVYFAF